MKKRIISLAVITALIMLLLGQAFAEAGFKDVKDTDWFKSKLEKLTELNIAGGYPDGTFRPNNSISRAEFTVMLDNAMKYGIVDGKPFTDVFGHWAQKYINTAVVNKAILPGEIGSRFNPNEPITRTDMTEMMCRALGLTTYSTPAPFTDMPVPNGWVNRVYVEGLMGGNVTGGLRYFNPSKATRAEVATILVNMVEYRNSGKKPVVDKPVDNSTLQRLPETEQVKLINVNLNDDKRFEELADIDGFISAANYGQDDYCFSYREMYKRDNTTFTGGISCTFYIGNTRRTTLLNVDITNYNTRNMDRLLKILDILIPQYKDKVYKAVSERMGSKGDDTKLSLDKTYNLSIFHSSNSFFLPEEQGVYFRIGK